MSEKLIHKSCEEFSQVLASRAAVPGGGGVSALVGAFGAALCSMAGNLTLGRKKYAAVEPDIRRMLAEGERIQNRLLELVVEERLPNKKETLLTFAAGIKEETP